MIRVITCIGPGGWDLYGARFVETFKTYWPKDVRLVVYHHDETFTPIGAPNIEYRDLLACDTEVEEFRDFCRKNPQLMGKGQQGYNFRQDAYKFCHKVYATTSYARELALNQYKGWLIWLDADTFTASPVSMEWISQFLPPDVEVVHLARKSLPYSETSFVGFNFKSFTPVQFLEDLRALYVERELFGYSEWHDGFVFTRLLTQYIKKGMRVASLTPPDYEGIDAFENSKLFEKMHHLKGARKHAEMERHPDLPPGMQPLKIVPQDSMPKEHILNNANESDHLMPRWLKPCRPHSRKAIIVSAGRSWKNHVDTIKKAQEEGAYIACIKHSLPLLMEEGIIPDACVVLDPRPVDKLSTHGVLRTTLFDNVSPKTTFYVASMTDTSVTKYILSKTDKVVGWFAWTQALAKAKPPVGQPIVTGGTCAAWRSISLLTILGFRHIRMYGFDFTVDKESVDMKVLDDKGRPKYLEIFIGEPSNPKPMVTTGELAAGIQDTPHIMQQVVEQGIDASIVGEDGAAYLWNFIRTKNNVDTKGPILVDFEKEYG